MLSRRWSHRAVRHAAAERVLDEARPFFLAGQRDEELWRSTGDLQAHRRAARPWRDVVGCVPPSHPLHAAAYNEAGDQLMEAYQHTS